MLGCVENEWSILKAISCKLIWRWLWKRTKIICSRTVCVQDNFSWFKTNAAQMSSSSSLMLVDVKSALNRSILLWSFLKDVAALSRIFFPCASWTRQKACTAISPQQSFHIFSFWRWWKNVLKRNLSYDFFFRLGFCWACSRFYFALFFFDLTDQMSFVFYKRKNIGY